MYGRTLFETSFRVSQPTESMKLVFEMVAVGRVWVVNMGY